MLIAVLVLGAAYVALAVVVGRQVPSQVTVEGVQVGGMTSEAAAATLKRELGGLATAPITVAVADTGKTFTVDPSAAGMSLDIDGSLAGMSGFSLNPVRIWEHLTGNVHRSVRTTVDEAKLAAAVKSQANTVHTEPKDGTISFPDGKVSVTPAVVGVAVKVDQLVEAIRSGYPRTPTVTAAVTRTEPKVTQAKVDAALASFATPAMSAPISLVVGDKTAPLVQSQYAPALAVTPDADGALKPTVDRGKITEVVVAATKGFLVQPQDARFVLQNDAPQIIPSVDGITVDSASIPDVVLPALTSPQRTATLKTTVAQPALTTAKAQSLGVSGVIASFDSTFPYNPSRTANLVAAANTVNGTFIPPGGTFSLNGILGERTADKGYQEGYVIEDGRLVKGTGGGVSQISTVVYNLAWFAGAELVEHTPHTFYIPRYPEGREATVYWPNLDNKWKNTSPHGMLVQMWVAKNQVHGRIWSTKVYDVEAVKGPRSNVRPGKELVDDTVECVPQPEMTPGFDVTVQRIFGQNGAVVKTESYTTHYAPEDKITCTNPNHKT
jgi:vancomycin resistance protein YoaR